MNRPTIHKALQENLTNAHSNYGLSRYASKHRDLIWKLNYYMETPDADNEYFKKHSERGDNYGLEPNQQYIISSNFENEQGYQIEKYNHETFTGKAIEVSYEHVWANEEGIHFESVIYCLKNIRNQLYVEQFVDLTEKKYDKAVNIYFSKMSYFNDVKALTTVEQAKEVVGLITIPDKFSRYLRIDYKYDLHLHFPNSITEMSPEFVKELCRTYYKTVNKDKYKLKIINNSTDGANHVYQGFWDIEAEIAEKQKAKIAEKTVIPEELQAYKDMLIDKLHAKEASEYHNHEFYAEYWQGALCALHVEQRYSNGFSPKTLYLIGKTKQRAKDTIEYWTKDSSWGKLKRSTSEKSDLFEYGEISVAGTYEKTIEIRFLDVKFVSKALVGESEDEQIIEELEKVTSKWSEKLSTAWENTKIPKKWDIGRYVPDYIRSNMDEHSDIVNIINYTPRETVIYYSSLLDTLVDNLTDKMHVEEESIIKRFKSTPFEDYYAAAELKYFESYCKGLFNYFKDIKKEMSAAKEKGFQYDW